MVDTPIYYWQEEFKRLAWPNKNKKIDLRQVAAAETSRGGRVTAARILSQAGKRPLFRIAI